MPTSIFIREVEKAQAHLPASEWVDPEVIETLCIEQYGSVYTPDTDTLQRRIDWAIDRAWHLMDMGVLEAR